MNEYTYVTSTGLFKTDQIFTQGLVYFIVSLLDYVS